MGYEHEGHRSRMLKKLASGQPLLEHELLEIVLYPVFPRKNTNDLAHGLLSAFGSMQGIYLATESQLRKIHGVGESVARYLYNLGAIYRAHFADDKRSQGEGKRFRPADFLAYVDGAYEKEAYEVLDMYLLNEKGEVCTVVRHTQRKTDGVNLPLSVVEKTLRRYQPEGLIVVHNHPSGTNYPSAADDDTTQELDWLCKRYASWLRDHFIGVSGGGVFSYVMSGRIKLFRNDARDDYAEEDYEEYRAYERLKREQLGG